MLPAESGGALQVGGHAPAGSRPLRSPCPAQGQPPPCPLDVQPSTNTRFFCKECGCHLWAQDPSWEQWCYPFAGAIDTELPVPPRSVHMMLKDKAPWVVPQVGPAMRGCDCSSACPGPAGLTEGLLPGCRWAPRTTSSMRIQISASRSGTRSTSCGWSEEREQSGAVPALHWQWTAACQQSDCPSVASKLEWCQRLPDMVPWEKAPHGCCAAGGPAVTSALDPVQTKEVSWGRSPLALPLTDCWLAGAKSWGAVGKAPPVGRRSSWWGAAGVCMN